MPVSGSDGSHFETEWDYIKSQFDSAKALSSQAKDMPSREETDRQQVQKELESAMPFDMRGPPPPTTPVLNEENQLQPQSMKDQNDPNAWGMKSSMNRTGPAMVPEPQPSVMQAQATPMSKPSNMEKAHNELQLSTQEQDFYKRHITNLNGPGGVDNPDGSRSTVFAAQVEIDGKHYVIPTVRDGKILPVDQAVDLAAKEGLNKFPSYDTAEQASQRYDELHKYMEKDTKAYMNEKAKAHEEAKPIYQKIVDYLDSLSDMQGAEKWTPKEIAGHLITNMANVLSPGRTPPAVRQGPGKNTSVFYGKENENFTPLNENNNPANNNYDMKRIDRTIARQIIEEHVRPDLGLTKTEAADLIRNYGEKFNDARNKQTNVIPTDKYLEINDQLKNDLHTLQRSKMSAYDKEVEAKAARSQLDVVEGGLNNTWKQHSDKVHNLTNKEGKEIGSAVYREHNDQWVGSRFNPENNQIIDRQSFNTMDEAMRYAEGDGPKLKQLQKDIKKIFSAGDNINPEFRQVPWGFEKEQMAAMSAKEYNYFINEFLPNHKGYNRWLSDFHDGVHNSNRFYFNAKQKGLSAKIKEMLRKITEKDNE